MTETLNNSEPAGPTYQAPTQVEPAPLPASPKKRFTKPQLILAGVAVAGLLIGGFAGNAIGGAGKGQCVVALDLADQGLHLAGETIGYASDGIKAAGRFSVSDMETATGDMKATASKIGDLAPKYKDASASCRK